MLLAQAYEELEKGDLAQASEKAWGAAAQMLKAIAQERGWHHHSHRDLYYNIELLERETGGADIVDLFGACQLSALKLLRRHIFPSVSSKGKSSKLSDSWTGLRVC